MHRRRSVLHRLLPMIFLCAATLAVPAFASVGAMLTSEEKRNLQRETLVLIELLQGYHYSNQPFHQVNSGELIESYFRTLDAERLFFLKGDTDFLRRRFERNLKTVYLFKGDLHPAFEIYDVFAKRLIERCAWVDARLNRPFPFEKDAAFETDREEAERPANAKAADALWEDVLQHELITERVQGRDLEAAVAAVRRRYVERRKRAAGADPLRVRELFLNSLMNLFDPHCGYFSKETADVVSGDLTGAVTGIGVDLRQTEGRFFVKRLQPGGPAERHGGIHPGDEFIAVTDRDAVEIPLAGRRLREVVELVRGKPGEKLGLVVRAAEDGVARSIELERSRMEIADNHASGLLYQVPHETGARAVGVVTLPAFYGDRENETTTSSMTRDVEELIAKFKARGAEAVVIDVRDNGGGLINEAVALTGLFIEMGPGMLTRGQSGKPTILRDDDPKIAFPGPLVVLTSRHSASASEGFAGAMQAYRRGLIVGGESTFGKGTMQWFVELGKTLGGVPDAARAQWGVARLTREFFYLPDGSSPQFDGVRSDVVLPTSAAADDYRESDLPHALPATRIPAPEILDTSSPTVARLTPELLETLRSATAARMATLPEFALETQTHALRALFWKPGPASLQLSVRQSEHDERNRQRLELREARRTLDADAAYPVERVDLDVVAEDRRLHQEILAGRKTGDGAPLANRLVRDTFYHQSADGAELRAVPLETLDWDVPLRDLEPLAAAWSAITGRADDERLRERIRRAMTAIQLRDVDAIEPVSATALFRENLGDALEETVFQRALSALLKKAAELEGDVLRDRRPLDVHLRESLRLAADWAALRDADAATREPAGEATTASTAP